LHQKEIENILCYTLIMDENQPLWSYWSQTLHRWGISGAAASLLEGSGSFGLLIAQVIYLSQPLLSGVVSASSLQAFARVLDNPGEKQAFIRCLRETASSGSVP
jgi:hypothetical protein